MQSESFETCNCTCPNNSWSTLVSLESLFRYDCANNENTLQASEAVILGDKQLITIVIKCSLLPASSHEGRGWGETTGEGGGGEGVQLP